MANLASALKEEIGRLARKEIRQQTAETARTVVQCAREIAALKSQIDGLQRKLASVRTQGAPGPTVTKKAASKKAATAKQAVKAASGSGTQSSRARFSAKGLKANRERLALSADNYGKLIGVSGLSIYNWEQGKARPRDSSIEALMTIRGIGKREAAKRLEGLAEPKAKAKPKAGPKAEPKAEAKTKAKTKAKSSRSAKDSKAAGEGQAKTES